MQVCSLNVPQYSLRNLNKKVVYYVVHKKKIYLAYDGTGLYGRKKQSGYNKDLLRLPCQITCTFVRLLRSSPLTQRNLFAVCEREFNILLNFLFCSAVWINLPLSIFAVSLCALCGCVIYAFYADCDPISATYIKKGDQVN